MRHSLSARIEALEKATRADREPLCIIFNCSCPGEEIYGYEWGRTDGHPARGQTIRRPGEMDDALLKRAEREAPMERWGGIILHTLSRTPASP